MPPPTRAVRQRPAGAADSTLPPPPAMRGGELRMWEETGAWKDELGGGARTERAEPMG
jgi:hypothetical protein